LTPNIQVHRGALAATIRHPDPLTLDTAVKFAASAVFLKEGIQVI